MALSDPESAAAVNGVPHDLLTVTLGSRRQRGSTTNCLTLKASSDAQAATKSRSAGAREYGIDSEGPLLHSFPSASFRVVVVVVVVVIVVVVIFPPPPRIKNLRR